MRLHRSPAAARRGRLLGAIHTLADQALVR